MVSLIEHSGEDRFFALLSYLGTFPLFIMPLFLIPLLARKDNKWIHNHAKQGMLVYLTVILLGWIPFIGWLIAAFYIILSIAEMIYILQGKPYFGMPILNDLANKIHI